MTNPTPLSPAAQAVLDAYNNDSDGEYVDGEWVVYERTMLAAALRAAADQAQASAHHASPPDTWAGPSNAWGRGWEEGVRDVAKGLLAIAAELEGAQ